MLLSLNWIRDFVDCDGPIDINELLERYTRKTAEVEGHKEINAHLSQIKVAEILSFRNHPDAEKLKLVKFRYGRISHSGQELVGEGDIMEVICGAPNVRVGLKTAYAPLNVTLPGGLKLEAKKIRGVLSEGMLLSKEELGLSDDSEGIIELPDEAEVGVSLAELWGVKTDHIIEIDNKSLTHRPDLWGIYGHARELSVILDTELKRPKLERGQEMMEEAKGPAPISLSIEEDSSCLGFIGLALEGIEVFPSPQFLRERLVSSGLRPINNLVDISNYVMLELGHPLHFYDLDAIRGGMLNIRKVQSDETLIVLDGTEHKLIAGDTVISDKERNLVLAGIVGGFESGVSEKTKKIFIEVANWKASSVRKTATRLGLRTDSSQRFEKSLDTRQLKNTLARALQLIIELCPEARPLGGLLGDLSDSPSHPLSLDLELSKISKVLGVSIPVPFIEKTFSRLGFELERENVKSYRVRVPSFRATKDIEQSADLIEEIGRIWGYDNIKESAPEALVAPTTLSSSRQFDRTVRDFLVLNARLQEIFTYPLIGETHLFPSDQIEGKLSLKNPLSKDASILRYSLVPSLIEAANLNGKHFPLNRFFELGKTYHKSDLASASKGNYPVSESKILGIVYFSQMESSFVALCETLEALLNHLGIPFSFEEKGGKGAKFWGASPALKDWRGIHPHEQYFLKIMGKTDGAVFSLHPALLREEKIKAQVSIALLAVDENLEKKALKKSFRYLPISRIPSSNFEFSVTARKGTSVSEILKVARSLKLCELKSVKWVRSFELAEGQKLSHTLRASFHDAEKTLSAEFLSSARDKLILHLKDAGFPLKTGDE